MPRLLKVMAWALLVAACPARDPEQVAVRAALAARPGFPAVREQVRNELVGLLSTACGRPEQEAFERLGEEGYAGLWSLAADMDELPSIRARAVTALMWAQPRWAREDYRRLAPDARLDPVLRRSALFALARLDGSAAVGPLESLLADADREVRDGAAWALGGVESPAAKAALRRRLAVEKDPAVRETLERFGR